MDDEELSLLGSYLCPCGPVGRAEPPWVGVILSRGRLFCPPVSFSESGTSQRQLQARNIFQAVLKRL